MSQELHTPFLSRKSTQFFLCSPERATELGKMVGDWRADHEVFGTMVLERSRLATELMRSKRKCAKATIQEMNAASKGIFVHRAPKGAGKTENAARLFALAGTGIAIAPTTQLTNDLARRFGIASYREEGADCADRLAICIPSLHRTDLYPVCGNDAVDLLFIDEATQIEHAIVNLGKCPVKATIQLTKLLNTATKVILADAHANDDLIRFIGRLTQRPIILVDEGEELLKFRKPEALLVRDFRAMAELIDQHIERGEKLAIACETASDAHSIEQWILGARPNHRLAVVAGRCYTGLSAVALSDITRGGSANYDTIIYTCAMGSGASIIDPDYKTVVLTYAGTVLPPQEASQMVSRFRCAERLYLKIGGNSERELGREEEPAPLHADESDEDDAAKLFVKKTREFTSSRIHQDKVSAASKLLVMLENQGIRVQRLDTPEVYTRTQYYAERKVRAAAYGENLIEQLIHIPDTAKSLALKLADPCDYDFRDAAPGPRNTLLLRRACGSMLGLGQLYDTEADRDRLRAACFLLPSNGVMAKAFHGTPSQSADNLYKVCVYLDPLRKILKDGARVTPEIRERIKSWIKRNRDCLVAAGIENEGWSWFVAAFGFRIESSTKRDENSRMERISILRLAHPELATMIRRMGQRTKKLPQDSDFSTRLTEIESIQTWLSRSRSSRLKEVQGVHSGGSEKRTGFVASGSNASSLEAVDSSLEEVTSRFEPTDSNLEASDDSLEESDTSLNAADGSVEAVTDEFALTLSPPTAGSSTTTGAGAAKPSPTPIATSDGFFLQEEFGDKAHPKNKTTVDVVGRVSDESEAKSENTLPTASSYGTEGAVRADLNDGSWISALDDSLESNLPPTSSNLNDNLPPNLKTNTTGAERPPSPPVCSMRHFRSQTPRRHMLN
ncbi:hypothetical protein CCP3SC1AL1_1860003 [Gammaproteobacteria bacterium]